MSKLKSVISVFDEETGEKIVTDYLMKPSYEKFDGVSTKYIFEFHIDILETSLIRGKEGELDGK